MIKRLHDGESPQEVKERFKQALENISPMEIGKIEQALIKEGISREEIQRLCNVHLAVFKEQLEKQKVEIPLENPVHILIEEHRVQQAKGVSSVSEEMSQPKHITEDLMDAEKHYLREENVFSTSGETWNY